MENITDIKPKNYMFVYEFDHPVRIIYNADSFKDAIYKRCEEEGLTSFYQGNLFEKALRGFDNDDVDGIVSLYNLFSEYPIYSVFLIDKQIYGCEEK